MFIIPERKIKTNSASGRVAKRLKIQSRINMEQTDEIFNVLVFPTTRSDWEKEIGNTNIHIQIGDAFFGDDNDD